MNVRTKLVLLSALGATVTGALAISAFIEFRSIRGNIDSMQVTATALRHQLEADMMHDALRGDVLAALLAETPEEIAQARKDFTEHAEWFRGSIGANNELALSESVRESLGKVREPLEAYIRAADGIIASAAKNKDEAKGQMPAFLGAFSTLEESMESVSDVVQGDVSGANEHANAGMRTATWAIGAVAGIGAIVLLAGATWIIRSINSRLSKCTQTLHKLAAGDLTLRVDLSKDDEIGELAASTDSMVGNFQSMVMELKRSADEVAGASNKIAAAAEETSAANNHISERAGQAGKRAEDAGRTAHEGSELFNRLLTDMDQITKAVQGGAQSVLSLGKRGEQIGELVTVINDIAEQTNLLALNAAIEAARAGEHGRGFAVVADEVRKLADRTAKATEQIAESIKAVQGETKQAVEKMETGRKQVESGAGGARDAAAKMSGIVAGSSEVEEMVRAITAAAEEAGQGAAQSAQVATELSTKAEELQGMVAKFRVK